MLKWDKMMPIVNLYQGNKLAGGVVVGRKVFLSSKIKHYREENVVQELWSQIFHVSLA